MTRLECPKKVHLERIAQEQLSNTAAAATGDRFVGNPIYAVIGTGSDLASSRELLVCKADRS